MAECGGLLNRRPSNVTPSEASTSESAPNDLASYLALLAEKSPDLAAVVKAWPDLPAVVKAGIVAMVKAAQGT